VARFVAANIVNELKANKNYHQENYEAAFKETFRSLDQKVKESKEELLAIKKTRWLY